MGTCGEKEKQWGWRGFEDKLNNWWEITFVYIKCIREHGSWYKRIKIKSYIINSNLKLYFISVSNLSFLPYT